MSLLSCEICCHQVVYKNFDIIYAMILIELGLVHYTWFNISGICEFHNMHVTFSDSSIACVITSAGTCSQHIQFNS